MSCPHGSITCLCKNSSECCYEGKDPMMCPRTGFEGQCICREESSQG